jgi:putative radical SAM enzyme (TIGR03279 family)
MSEGVRIVGVEPSGIAERAGLQADDRLLSINNHPLEDQIDVLFHASALRLALRWERNGEVHKRTVVPRPVEPFGWELEPFAPRRCTNRCPFCFVSQMPPGMREPLYVYDEDYRLSFLYGHYITGTNLTSRDLDRIAKQRLSPLYISVHATDPQLRAKMLGRKRVKPIVDLFRFFTEKRIAFHTQIVVCPEWNDGAALLETLDELRRWHPAMLSVALVPVGLTAHREGLPKIRRVTPRYAGRMIDDIGPVIRQWRRELDEDVLFLADEWYLRAGRRVPAYRGIDVAPQFENGVGMVAGFMRPWGRLKRRLPVSIERKRSTVVVTGALAAVVLRPVVERLNEIRNLRVSLVPVRNRLFGPAVTVSGLLAGADILETLLKRKRRPDRYLLPANCLRPWDKVFLDDMTLEHMAGHLARPVLPVEGTVRELVEAALNE